MVEVEKLSNAGNIMEYEKNKQIIYDLASNSNIPLDFLTAFSAFKNKLPEDSNNEKYIKKALPIYLQLLPNLEGRDINVIDLAFTYSLLISRVKSDQNTFAMMTNRIEDLQSMQREHGNLLPPALWRTFKEGLESYKRMTNDAQELIINTFFVKFNHLKNKPNRRFHTRPSVDDVLNAIKDTEDYFSVGSNRLRIITLAKKGQSR